MCGVVARFVPRGDLPALAADGALERALGALHHRGPDGRGAWRSPDGRVELGHTRLAIVDRAGGAQPLANERGDVVAVVNGELYGEAALRAELTAAGHRLATRSDSELLVHLYEDAGLACAERVRGELAFVLWDARRRRLVAGRDRLGVKPLVWTEHAGVVAVASEVKALAALGVPLAWDAEAFGHAATHQYLPPDATLFRGVFTLEPGCLLVVDEGQAPRVVRYWDALAVAEGAEAARDDAGPDADAAVGLHDVDAAVGLHDADAAVGLHDALDAAVRERLRAEVPVAFHLSGGVDSASILALGTRAAGSPRDAFCVRFHGAPHDELDAARVTARHVGARLHVVDASADALADALPAAVLAAEGLAVNGQLPAKWLLARELRAAGFRVVLSGEGADEALLGYAHLAADAAADAPTLAPSAADARAAATLQSGLMLPDPEAALPPDVRAQLDAVRAHLGAVPMFLAAKAGLGAMLAPLLRPEFAAATRARAPLVRLVKRLDPLRRLRALPRPVRGAHLWTRLALGGYILRALGDATEMAFGVEGRPPFLDPRVFERAWAMPVATRLRGGVEKAPLRAAMAGLLPDAVRARPKQPFLAPPILTVTRSRGEALLRALVDDATFAAQPFFEPAAVRAACDAARTASDTRRRALEPALWLVACTALLQRHLAPTAP